MFLLLMVIAILPSSYAYVDCQTACRHCRENREHAILLEVHCAMCRECKLRRKGMQQSQVSQSTAFRPLPRQRLRTGSTPSHAARMQNQEQVDHVAHEEYSDYPEGCPTPPECESGEELVTLKMSTTGTTIPTTTTTCPPIPVCKQKQKRHTQAQSPLCAPPVCAPTTCTPCMPMCALPCVQYQPPVTECHSQQPLKLTYTTQPPTQVVNVPAPTEVKTQVLFQQSVNQLLIQQSAQQAMQASHQAEQAASQGQQQVLLQEAANQALQAANQGQQQLLLQQAASQAIQSLNQAMQSNQSQNQVVFQQQGQNQVLNNQVTVPQMSQPALLSAGTAPDYYYLYLGVPNNMMNKD